MSSRSELVLKMIYLGALLIFALALLAMVESGVDSQVEALPYFAEVWGR